VKKARPKRRPARPAWGKLAGIAGIFLTLYLVWRHTSIADVITVELVLALAEGIRGSIWPRILLVLAYTPSAFVMFPRPLLTLFAAVAYGPWWGFTLSMAGIMVSAVVVYYIGRTVSQETLRRLAGDKFDTVTDAWRAHGLIGSIAVSIAPVAPFVVIGMVAGAKRVKLWHYLAGTAVGMLPGTIATTLFANEISNALDDPSKINYWVVAAIILVLVALTLFSRRLLVRIQRQSASA
jgi:phospholipase D1/2